MRHLRRDAEVDFGRTSSPACSVLCRALRRGKTSSFFALRLQSGGQPLSQAAARLAGDRIIRERRNAAGAGAGGRVPAPPARAILLLVTCKQGELEAACRTDTPLADLEIEMGRWPYLPRCSTWTPTRCCASHRSKAVFRAAMNIELNRQARRRQFSKSDYAELALH